MSLGSLWRICFILDRELSFRELNSRLARSVEVFECGSGIEVGLANSSWGLGLSYWIFICYNLWNGIVSCVELEILIVMPMWGLWLSKWLLREHVNSKLSILWIWHVEKGKYLWYDIEDHDLIIERWWIIKMWLSILKRIVHNVFKRVWTLCLLNFEDFDIY